MPHLLKRLELNGFKSFANKTVLEFPTGITAIVGPNGSGKSNVIDAIRWLLGERDAKNLRGGKGEDLIFAGTPKRPRVGLAQASLHFDNPPLEGTRGKPFDEAQGKQHFFPVEFGEVTVSREIGRGGESTYFLNRSEVRLKDIIDFFAAARLGSRGITVVTQGNSDMVLRASPEERREMIEEVLGLKEYQIKKHEAERRLRSSQINLDKVKALMEEIAPHLRSLKRQTSRWERRDEYAKELREIEDRFFGTQLSGLGRDLARVEGELRAHEGRRQDIAARKDKAEQALVALESAEPKEREELKALQASIKEIEDKRNELSRELARLEARMEMHAASAKVPEVGLAAAELTVLVKNARQALQEALQDPSSLEGAVKRVLADIDAAFSKTIPPGRAGAKPVVQDPALSAEFEKVSKSLHELENRIMELRDRERSLEKSQESFYRAFKEEMASVQSARDALDEWSRTEQAKTLEHERLLMRKEEVEHRVREAGRRPEEFAEERIGNSAFASPSRNASDERGKASADTRESRIEGDAADMERRMFRLRGELAAMGEVDETVVNEARTTEERYQFLERESGDLVAAEADLRRLIRELNEKIHVQFSAALVKINGEFQKFFELMFGGGTGKLVLEKPEVKKKKEDMEEDEGQTAASAAAEEDLGEPKEEKEPGIEIKVSLPRKRIGSLDMLSGGERSLVGIATLFALISVSPPPFLVLDEIDAPLDERNARRFAEMLKEFSKETQFIIVTHNRATMEAADVLYGVTLGEDGTSKVLSMKFAEEAKV